MAGVVILALALLALDANQRAEQGGDGEIARRGKKLLVGYGLRPISKSSPILTRLRAEASSGERKHPNLRRAKARNPDTSTEPVSGFRVRPISAFRRVFDTLWAVPE